MEDHNLLSGNQWQPFYSYGFTHKFWTINIDTVLSTTIITLFLIGISLYTNYRIQKNKDSVFSFITIKYVEMFKDLLQQTLQSSPLHHLAFIGSLFTFVFLCNTISCVPYLEEPTRDLNTTLAVGLISFFYVQGYAVATKGFGTYLYDFTQPFILMLPLNLIGTLTSIISLSFRLFGNIFGGSIISSLITSSIESSLISQIFGLLGINLVNFLIFGLFEGLIQAFVFSMLTLTNLSMEIVADEESE